MIVVAPRLDQDLSFTERVKYLSIQQLVAQLPIERLEITVFPRRTGFDICGLGANVDNPLAYGLGDKFYADIAANTLWSAARQHQVGQNVDHLEHADLSAVMGAMLDKIYAPTWLRRSARSRTHKPSLSHRRAALWLSRRHFQPILPPETRDPLGVAERQPTLECWNMTHYMFLAFGLLRIYEMKAKQNIASSPSTHLP